MGKGYLTGKIDKNTTFSDGDFRNIVPRFNAEHRDVNLKLVEFLADIAAEKKATPAQIALAWLLAQKPWIVPIPGTTKAHRLDENIAADSIALSADDLKKIESVFLPDAVQGDRYPASLQARVGK